MSPLWNPIGWNHNVKKPNWSKFQRKVTLLGQSVGQRNLIGWCTPPPKFHWLKPSCQETLLDEISTKNNFTGPNYRLQKSDWLICLPARNPIGWNRNVKKSYWSKFRPKVTLLDQSVDQRNLIGWCATLPETPLVETAMSKNPIGRNLDQK